MFLMGSIQLLPATGSQDLNKCVYQLRESLQVKQNIRSYQHENAKSFDEHLEAERRLALQFLLENILPNGAVAAATSDTEPNYRFYWHRDAALVYATLWKETKNPQHLEAFLQAEKSFLAQSSAGEPKSHLDFTPFTDPWARPQNDGPALAILTLANLVDHNQSQEAQTLILQLAHYVADMKDFGKDVEPWEEDHGKHFYNGRAQHAALLKAAKLAEAKGDTSARDRFISSAADIEKRLKTQHWDAQQKRILPTIERPTENRWFFDKVEDLDIQVLLAYLHTGTSVKDSKLMSSFEALRKSFINEFPINRSENKFKYAVAMGRYPNDKWDGVNRTGANPWFISTFASAEFFYKLKAEVLQSGSLNLDGTNKEFFTDLSFAFQPHLLEKIDSLVDTQITASHPDFQAYLKCLQAAGDEFLMLGLSHGALDGRLSEQFSRENGFMLGAENLTWSYAALLSAIQARTALANH